MTSKNEPLVSIIMPCYNDGCYLNEAVQSLDVQTYSNLELIVIDDGSDDKITLQVLEQLNFRNLQVIHIQHSFPAAARNRGLAIAKGKYIVPLDADDKIAPSYIQKAVDILESSPDVGAVYCHAAMFGDVQGDWDMPDFDIDYMLIDNIVFVTSVIRQSILSEVGGFDESLIHGMEDYDFFLSLLERDWKIYQLPETLFYYRTRTDSRSRKFIDNTSFYNATYDSIYQKHRSLYLEHMDHVFPLVRGEYLRLRSLSSENLFLKTLVRQKGPKALLRLVYHRYFWHA